MMQLRSRNSNRNEIGSMMVTGLGLILFLGIIAAIVIDLSMAEFVTTRLQAAADATALAATSEYGSLTQKSFLQARRAAILALRKNKLLGHTDGLPLLTPNYFGQTSVVIPGNVQSTWDLEELHNSNSKTEYSNSHLQFGNLNVIIERGFYGRVDKEGMTIKGVLQGPDAGCDEYTFVSLEGPPLNSLNSNTNVEGYLSDGTTCGGITAVERCNVGRLANSTRVTLTLDPYQTFFTSFFPGNFPALQKIRVVSVSSLSDFDDFNPSTCPPP